ncbi:copper resistance protein B precursor [Erythrobacter sp. NAP1]|uniref:copper resistance protein B n=1 Tax=Erythrobacter sp. NAP1 TaxID=237727 RepID=UPI00006877AB|nr:copper resistance protein B [Erythrobacter sp. NAP1]EAQ28034.1 copper resistance protein B precursor [Erythrobacter sp. NAP1]
MRFVLLASAALFAAPVAAQDHSAHGSHGTHEHAAQPEPTTEVDHCAMGHLPPEQCPPEKSEAQHGHIDHSQMDHSQHQQETGADEGAADHSDMDHSDMGHGSMDHAQMDHSAMDHSQMGHGQHGGASVDKTAPGAAPESAVPERAFDGPRHAADAIWGTDAMASSRRNLARENGGMRTGSVLIERLEARIAADGGEDGYVWDAQAFYGGDINRFVLKTEGEGEFGGELEDAEIQALYSRAIGPFFDLQAGVRFDPEPDTRGHLVVGIQGLAPYMFHVDGALFLSDRGDLTARLEGEYDQRITQRLIIQPRLEVELAAQDNPERGIGAGLTKVEPGLRLRYEIEREFAPYIGVEYEAKLGETADIARAAGDDPDGFKVLIGVRAWF